VIAKLKAMDLWRGQSEHAMTLPLCSRTGDVIEPMLKEQWFAKSSKLFDFCSQSIEDKSLQLIPENRILLWNNYSNMYRKKDWCISRQLWWGQRIPAYKCQIGDEEKWFVARTEEEAKIKAIEHFKTDQVKLEQGI
jgi:valyl-tRNA synthetase